MAGILDFSQYIGGADSLQVEQTFPSNQRTVVYNFGQDITGWNFHVDYQTIIADQITFDRNTGAPNFATSKIIGTFPAGVISTSSYVKVLDANSGTVAVTFPSQLYDGGIIPDARVHNPITVVGISWTTSSIPAVTDIHRWAFIQSWEPGTDPSDPIMDVRYTPVEIGG